MGETKDLQIILSEIYQHSYTPDHDARAIVFDIGEQAKCGDWNGCLLAVGTSDASISIFNPVALDDIYTLPTKFQKQYILAKTKIDLSSVFKSSVDFLQFTSRYLLAASVDSSKIILINHVSDQQSSNNMKLSDIKHQVFDLPPGFINSMDVNDDGVIAVAMDSKQVMIYNCNDIQPTPMSFRLTNIPTMVQFASFYNREYLLILEATNIVKILDWKSYEWLVSIYPTSYDSNNAKSEVSNIFTTTNELLISGLNGWFKKYDLNEIIGGAGYTKPSSSGTLFGFLNPESSPTPVTISKSTNSFNNPQKKLANITKQQISVYDFDRVLKTSAGGDNGVVDPKVIKVNLPSYEICAGSISEDNVVAITSGTRLLLVSLNN
ncbi:hypothetical protein DASC09_061480 [Saccharomycopsis crataegensis]|uniref:Uncharacterized protein n=1 Tax=Saccharomycopsis crataegensis TaxID=43959 RepID=A0AAV5QVG8_9ASCO|nr:hypothetical protein DASC09_061480 [Saccharomycopsis crataegensis]